MNPFIQVAMLAITFGLLERAPRLRFQPARFFRRAFSTDVLHLVTSIGLSTATLAWVALGSAALGALGVPRLAALAPSGWLAVPLCVALLDFGHYAVHWSLHRSNALWELHKVHHSSPALDWLATFRAHLVEQALRHFAAPLLLLVLGPPLPAVALALVVHGIFAVLNHSNLALPLRWLEPVLVTPRLHRIHHVADTSEKNLGVVLTLWDRLRGSFAPDADPRGGPLGVPGELERYPETWAGQLVRPFRRAPGALRGEPARAV